MLKKYKGNDMPEAVSPVGLERTPYYQSNFSKCIITLVALLALGLIAVGVLGLNEVGAFSAIPHPANIAMTAVGAFAIFALAIYGISNRCNNNTEKKPLPDRKAESSSTPTRSTDEAPPIPAVKTAAASQKEEWISEPEGKTQFTCGGDSACTPLATLFASCGKLTTTSLLELFSSASEKIGFQRGRNYTAEEAITMVNNMGFSVMIMENWNMTASENSKGMGFRGSEVIEQQKTWKEVISDMQPGEGAIIQFAGYTLSARRFEKHWEFFDSHNGQDLAHIPEFSQFNIQKGAYIRRCLTKESATEFLGLVIKNGPAGANLGNDLANAVEITIV